MPEGNKNRTLFKNIIKGEQGSPCKKDKLVTEKKVDKNIKIRSKFASSKYLEVGHCHNWFCVTVVGDL